MAFDRKAYDRERSKKKRYRAPHPDGSVTVHELPEPVPANADTKQLISQLNKVTKLAVYLQERVSNLSEKVRADGLRKPIDKDIPEMVYELAQLGCTANDIARILGISESNILQNYHEAYNLGLQDTRMSLRRKQLDKAGVYDPERVGDTTMLIWLGKQLLEQRDQPQVVIENNINTGSVKEKLKGLLIDQNAIEIQAEVLPEKDDNNNN